MGLVLLCTLVLAEASPVSAAGPRCYVKADAAGLNNGTSWEDAYTNLQSALAATPCTEVWVAKGTYKPTAGTNRVISFALHTGLSLYGGFAGTETLPGQRKPAVNVTILSGNIGDPGTSADNSYHVVVSSGTGPGAVLDGFTITGGRADGTAPFDAGGGLYAFAGSPTLRNLVFSSNSATRVGGGLYNNSGNPTLTRVTFQGNSAIDGGGMASYRADFTLTEVTFRNNTAGMEAGRGGGLFSDWGSKGKLTDVTFVGNRATMGGGMLNRYLTSPTLTNVTFINNWAKDGGGGLWNAGWSNPSLANVTFTGNRARNKGGGLYNYSSFPTLTNVTFSGNFAHHGGAIRNKWNSRPVVQNSILYGNTGEQIFNDTGGSIDIHHSIIQGGYAGEGNLDADPLLSPLQDNGGRTLTMAPSFGSPAIDTGTSSGCPAEDQRGMARPQDGDGNGVALCDMGAIESPLLYGETLESFADEDGWVLESTEFSGVGGSKNSGGRVFIVGDDAEDKQYQSILSFDTAGLPDNAIIISVALRIQRQGIVGSDPFVTHGGLKVDIRKPHFGAAAALAAGDFQAAAGGIGVGTFSGAHSADWRYSTRLSPDAYPHINRIGTTQLRLRFLIGDDEDQSGDHVKFYTGNAPNARDHPKLIITYYLP